MAKNTRKLRRRRVNKRNTFHRGGGGFFFKHTTAIRTLFKEGKGNLVINEYNRLFNQFGVMEPGTGNCKTSLIINPNDLNSMTTEKKADFVISKYNEAQLSTTCSTYNQKVFNDTVKGFEKWLLEQVVSKK